MPLALNPNFFINRIRTVTAHHRANSQALARSEDTVLLYRTILEAKQQPPLGVQL